MPSCSHTRTATAWWSPVAMRTAMPSLASRATAAPADTFGGSESSTKPTKVRADSSPAVMATGGPPDRPGTGFVATATTRLPRPTISSSVRLVLGGTPVQRLSTDSGAPFVIMVAPSPTPVTTTDRSRRSWSNGNVATVRQPFAGAGVLAWMATSSGLPDTRTSPSSTTSLHRRARTRVRSLGFPSGPSAPRRAMAPSVSVPVLSVMSISMFPRSSMLMRRFTSTLRAASRRLPVERLTETIAGSSCGVIPMAIARENRSASTSGRPSTKLMTKMATVSAPATPASMRENELRPTWKAV